MPAAGIDFEYCAVMQSETKSFTLVNSSNSLLQFEIVTDKDNTTFKLEPQTGKLHYFIHNIWKLALIFVCYQNIGMLRAGHKQEIKIHFKPLEAKVMLSTAVFKFQEGDKTA